MREGEPRCVQCLAAEVLECMDERWRRARREPATSAIHWVAHDGIFHMREMHANLVRAPGLEPHARERVRAKTFLDAVVRHRRASIAAHCHLRAVRAMPTDGLVH